MDVSPPLLAMKGITKRFGQVEALVDVDFEVSAGEVVALVGDNGAGKSTLIKAISGIQPADAGKIWFDGKQLDEAAMEHRTLELLDGLGVTTLGSVRTSVGSLSGGQRQSVAIARSLLGEPRLVILDEPTAALGVIQTQHVLELIDHLKARGLGVIVISHNLRNVFHIADRIVVLSLGRRAASFDRRSTSRAEVVAAITGATADAEAAAA